MATAIIFEEQLEIPLVQSLADFRKWATSDEFPEHVRIDYLAGRIEVDMSPEDFFCHGTPKTEIVSVLAPLVKQENLGYLVSDQMRVSCLKANLSAQPDVVFISEESLQSGRIRLVPKATGEPDRYVEVEGPPDLVVEIVSDSSVGKDTRRLPARYLQAGVGEFWLVDARGKKLVFQIHNRGDKGWLKVRPDAQGFQRSAVLGRRFQLTRRRNQYGRWVFDLNVEATA